MEPDLKEKINYVIKIKTHSFKYTIMMKTSYRLGENASF